MSVKGSASSLLIRGIIMALISFGLLAFASNVYGAEEEDEHILERFTSYLDMRIPVLMADYDIPGASIALIQKGKTTWVKAYGHADLEAGRKMTVDTPVMVQSISKPVTAWGVMKLVQEGKIQLDHSVERYLNGFTLPETAFSEEKVTVRNLLSNSAGMPLGNVLERYSPKGKIPSLEESLSREAWLQREPSEAFSYSNTGFNLLELLIEEVTGREFARYMEEEVLLPLGMDASSFTWSEQWYPPVPTGYDTKGAPVPVYVYPGRASGGLFATVEDIASFVSAGMPGFSQRGSEVLDTQNIRLLHTPAVEIPGLYGLAFDYYGLGHFIETLPDDKTSVSHGGQGYGWMTHFQSVPETGDGIVILTNSQRSWPFFAHILSDWSEWNGLPPVGMSRIILAQRLVWALTGMIMITVFWRSWHLGKELTSGRRRFAPLSKNNFIRRSVEACLSVVLLSCLFWCICQDYLFITSLLPKASFWLGVSIFGFALVLLSSAVFPFKQNKQGDGSIVCSSPKS
ncbi:MAG: serine hydrolase domain-containing protein [Bacillota bacterium]